MKNTDELMESKLKYVIEKLGYNWKDMKTGGLVKSPCLAEKRISSRNRNLSCCCRFRRSSKEEVR